MDSGSLSAIGVLLAALFTGLSLIYLKKTSNFIEKQTQASIAQADVTRKLLDVELGRDNQINLVSGYIICEAKKMTTAQRTQWSPAQRSERKPFFVNVTAHINNQSSQPIFQIVAKLHKRQRAYNGNTFLTSEDIPISVVGPRTDREFPISENFKSAGFDELNDFHTLDEAQDQAKKIEIEFSIVLHFRGSDGLFYKQAPDGFFYQELNESDAITQYENAIINNPKKKPPS